MASSTFSINRLLLELMAIQAEDVYLNEGVKQGLGLIYCGGQLVEWGVGARVVQLASFVFLSGVEGKDPETNRLVEGGRL